MKKGRKFYIAIIIVLLAFGAIEVGSGGPSVSSHHRVERELVKNDGYDHIELKNNTQLRKFAEEKDLSGDGTEENPFVLSDHRMDGQGERPGLHISNIDLHFIIDGCKIHNSSDAGVVLFQVSNLTMKDNEIKDVGTGLYLEDSQENRFFSNLFSGSQKYGVHIKGDGTDNIFYENRFEGCSIYLEGDGKGVSGQEISPTNVVDGKPIYYINNEKGEAIRGKNAGQVIITDSDEVQVENTIIDRGSIGILVLNSQNVSVRESRIESQNADGIQIRESENVILTSSRILENGGEGIELRSSKNITIKDNLIEGSDSYGITLGDKSMANEIYLNAFKLNRAEAYLYSESYPSQAKDENDPSSNRWNSSEGLGNYWEPNTGIDGDGNGLIDDAYEIDGGEAKDKHPLSSTIGPPQDITVNPRDEGAELSWSEPSYSILEPFKQIDIYRGTEEGNITFHRRVNASTEKILEKNLSNENSYYYRLQASNGINMSVLSPSFRVTPDGTPPSIVEYSPTGDEVPVNSTLTIRFSEEMLKDSVNISVEEVPGEVTGEGAVYHFEPRENLSYGERYDVKVRGKDRAMNPMEEESWSFTTVSAAVISGRIVSPDGEPIEGVLVTSEGVDPNTTDSEGRFEIKAQPGTRVVKISREGFFEKEIEIEVEPGQEKDLGEIELEEERGLKGSRWFWPLISFAFIMIALGVMASFTYLRGFRAGTGKEEDEVEIYEEHYEELSQEEFDSWWENE
ncbi:MAG: right-handed parallel beta-helix repeat-containing protein [Candidatus Natronoplasma sp.]